MNIAHHHTQDLILPAMDDQELKRYYQYQNGRIESAKRGFCIDMLPIAKDLKELAENEMRARGIDYSVFKKLP